MKFKEIAVETEKIIKEGWIKSRCAGTGGMGITFEKLLNIETNTLEIPDYDGIEIKTKSIHKNGYITLFSATPDSYLFEIKRIKDAYGYPDSILPAYKIFNMSIYANEKVYIGKNLFTKIKVDRVNNKLVMIVFDRFGNLIDDKTSWSFDLLEEKISRKLSKLLLVFGDKKIKNGVMYYRYLCYKCYNFTCFENFLDAIEDGKIRVTFKIGVVRSGDKLGNIHDHGTSFDICENKLDSIYKLYNIEDGSTYN